MINKGLLMAGLASPVLYGGTVILGGFLTPGYSHRYHAISELTASGAPAAMVLNILFTLSLFLALIFGIGALSVLGRFKVQTLNNGIGLLVVIALLSLLWPLFPMDPRGAETSIGGIIHLVLAALVAPMTILCPLLVGLGSRKLTSRRGYPVYSVVSAAIILIAGLAAVGSTGPGALLGVYERVTIGAYQQWMAGTALFLYTVPQSSSHGF
ncbi:MAG: DUF998 domain-containing protein [Limnochordia bacterium]